MNQLSHSLGVYQTVRDRIMALEADVDETTLADTLEGLTDIHEVLAAIVRSALLDEALAEGRGSHLGEAHDLALKAAETDATQRALVTFGKAFGLALYSADKREPARPGTRHPRQLRPGAEASLQSNTAGNQAAGAPHRPRPASPRRLLTVRGQVTAPG
jgi:hypothetical protein